MSQYTRFWCLSRGGAAKAQMSLIKCAGSLQPSLLTYTRSHTKGCAVAQIDVECSTLRLRGGWSELHWRLCVDRGTLSSA